jgi:triphosphoribosyl-dephospho-CoA synthase
MSDLLSIGQCVSLACLLEATAPKPGNVHRGADFPDVTYPEFIASGIAIAPVMQMAPNQSLGETILGAVNATRRVVRTNTNLGMILLLAPLAAVPREVPLRIGVESVLKSLSVDDCRDVYAAIRVAQPGGLGKVSQADIGDSNPPTDLLAAMRLAADRDMIARQYVENFSHVFDCAAAWLADSLASNTKILDAIVQVHLRLMSQFPDSLIARKCGPETATKSAHWAAQVLAAGPVGSEEYLESLADLDFWLRADGNRRNPGTTADLITAGLFVLLRDGIIQGPLFSDLS